MKISGHGLACELTFSSPDNEGWMRATVQLKVPGFEGSFTCTVEKEEWKSFIQALRHLESSVGNDAKASWGNMEENIEFHFILHKRGAIEATYKFSPENFSSGPTLSGAFEADQTFLQGWARSAQQVFVGCRRRDDSGCI